MDNSILCISPIDGRYVGKTSGLRAQLSEFGLIKYRVLVEWKYLLALRNEAKIKELQAFPEDYLKGKITGLDNFSVEDAQSIKKIEATTNHDVKAVEYFIKAQLEADGYSHLSEWVHFALTSQDINNTAIPMSFQDSLNQEYLPLLDDLCDKLLARCQEWEDIAMLARTHGQAASPTKLGKEFYVFYSRIRRERAKLEGLRMTCKFGGATGNFNAHHVCFPEINWIEFANTFCTDYLNLERTQFTTQIEPYDQLAEVLQTISRINNIIIDASKDIWSYISNEYFGQKLIANEVGSSAMPHKVNPIDFENAEGNLGLANALLHHLANKLPISRWQRDLTDSTVLRNIGVPLGHGLVAFQSFIKGLSKIELNEAKISEDLNNNPMVISEAIQNILRRENFPKPYEALKKLTRGNSTIELEDIYDFVKTLDVTDSVRAELLAITPSNYVGVYLPLVKM